MNDPAGEIKRHNLSVERVNAYLATPYSNPGTRDESQALMEIFAHNDSGRVIVAQAKDALWDTFIDWQNGDISAEEVVRQIKRQIEATFATGAYLGYGFATALHNEPEFLNTVA